MARISRATNQKIQNRYGSSWRPRADQLGLGALGLAGLGYLAYKYPTQTTKLAQKGLAGLITNLPGIAVKSAAADNQVPTKYMGEKILSNFLPFGVTIRDKMF